MDCRLFSLRSYANNRENREVSVVLAGCGRKQPRDPRSVGCSGRTRKQTTERSTKCRLFRTTADANSRENREVSAVPVKRGSKQPREPRSVGCSGRTQMQTTERSTKCRLFRTTADANSRENREVSAVPVKRGSKQPREPRSVGCSGRTQMQTTERTAKCRLFQPNADANSRYSS